MSLFLVSRSPAPRKRETHETVRDVRLKNGEEEKRRKGSKRDVDLPAGERKC